MFSISDVFAMTPTDVLIVYWVITIIFGLGFICGLFVCIVDSAFHLEETNDKLKVALMIIFLVGLIAMIYIPFNSQDEYEIKYKQMMAVDTQAVYTELDLLEMYEVHRAKGSYRVDTSRMAKELYIQCIHDSVNPYEVIVVPNSK